MAKNILGFVAGFAAMVAWVLVTQGISWTVLGRSFAFAEGTLRPSAGWLLLHLFLGFVGALIGGFTARTVARKPQPVMALASFVLAYGLVMGVAEFFVERPPPPPPEQMATMSMAEVQRHAVQPGWFRFTLPVLAFVGVLVGGRERRREAG